MATALSEMDQLREKVASLEAIILTKHPTLPSLLSQILQALQQQPEQVLLLSPEEISQVVAGIEIHKGVFLAASVTKPAAQKTGIAKIKANAASALGFD
jgi:DNA polymerase III psi subunit